MFITTIGISQTMRIRTNLYVVNGVLPGEVLGIAGLGGSGRTETAKLIFGAHKKKSGTIILNGKEIKISTPVCAVKHQIGFVSEDRKEDGVFLPLSIRRNISVTNFTGISGKLGFINTTAEYKNVLSLIEKLSIRLIEYED